MAKITLKLQWPASIKEWHPKITQTTIAFTLKITAILVATLTVFFQDLTLIFSDALQSETTSYMLAVPFIFLYLIYRKRKMLRAVMPPSDGEQPANTRYLPSVAGILLAATAILLYWYGSYTFTPLEYHMFALPLFAAGLCLFFFNPQTLRQLAFPIAFLFFLMPPPAEILYTAGSTLQVFSAEASNAIVNAFRIPSTLATEYGNPLITITRADGNTIPFQIDIACSGIYSLIGFTIFAVSVVYIIRDKLWKKLALIAVGIPIIYLLNIIRITSMLFIGYNYGAELALQAFHILGGWVLIFLGTFLLLLISEKAFKTQIFGKPVAKCARCNPRPQQNRDYCLGCGRIIKPPTTRLHTSDIAKITAIILAAALLLAIQAPIFAITKGPPTVTVNTPSGQQFSTEVLPQNDQYTLEFSLEDKHFEALAQQDLSLLYLYEPLNTSKEVVWVSLEIASTTSSLHGWEVCLMTYPLAHGRQSTVTQIDLRDIQLMENPPIISRYFAFSYTATNQTQVVLYWYETSAFMINSTSQEKHVKISLIAYPRSMAELPEIETQLVTLGTAIANYWEPTKTWFLITMLMSQNGLTLTAATSTVLALTIIYYGIQTRKRKQANLNATAKLTKSNKEIVRALQETKKPATLESLATSLQKNAREKTTTEQLEQKLQELQKTGIITKSVYNRNDEPVQTWKT